MNQILEYNTNGGNLNPNSGSDKIIRIFAIVLIIFAVVLVIVAVNGKNSNKDKIEEENNKVTYADIAVEVNESNATIKVLHDKKIEKLIYSWNSNNEKTIKSNTNEMEETIEIPVGENTLHIKVIDEDGNETSYDYQTNSESGIDIISPRIELSIDEETNNLKIIAIDETELSFITYRWNDGEEEKINVNDDNKKEIETEIEILRDENDLTIIAVDASNNTTTERKSFIGRTSPIISVTASDEEDSIIIRANDEYGISSVKFRFNDVDYNVGIGDGTPNNIEFEQKLVVGKNTVYITVTNIYGIETKYSEEREYIEIIEEDVEENSDIDE